MFFNLSTPTVTEVSPDTEASSGNLQSTESPSGDLFCKLKETNAFDYPESPTGRGNRFVENKENDDGGWLFLASLDKLTKNKLCDKISQLLASQNTVRDKELSERTDLLQTCICLQVSKVPRRESSLAVTELKMWLNFRENQIPASDSVGVWRALSGKKRNPVTWNGIGGGEL